MSLEQHIDYTAEQENSGHEQKILWEPGQIPTSEFFYSIYEQFGKTYEAEHIEEFLAVSPSGRTIITNTQIELMEKITEELGEGAGAIIYKVGEINMGKMRSPLRLIGFELSQDNTI